MPRRFDPPLKCAEIARVYDFTTRLLERLGMPQWRLQVRSKPAPKRCYADIRATPRKFVGEIRLGAGWMNYDLEEERIPTLLHEILHLTHRDLTDLCANDIHRYVPSGLALEFSDRFDRAVELWVDHLTQITLGLLTEDIAFWAAEIWGPDWRDESCPDNKTSDPVVLVDTEKLALRRALAVDD